nr:A24 family peptidase [Methylonatrum kenyense]
MLTLTLLICAATSDLVQRRIPNTLIASAAIFLSICAFLDQEGILPWVGLAYGLIGLMTALVFTLPGWLLNKVGGGDVKLSMLLGAFLGPTGYILSVVLALPFGLIFLVGHRLAARPIPVDLPVGAFLAGGASVVLLVASWSTV